MNAKISVFVICVEAVIYSVLYDLHDCTFNFLDFLLYFEYILPNTYTIDLFSVTTFQLHITYSIKTTKL